MALLYHEQGRDVEAVPLFERAIEIRSKALGDNHAEVGQSHNKIALALQALGRFEEAEAHYEKALLIRQQALGLDHPDIVQNSTMSPRCMRRSATGRRLSEFSRYAREIILRRAQRGSLATAAVAQGGGRDEIAQTRKVFSRLVRVAWPLQLEQANRRAELTEEAFAAAQWAGQTTAEVALAQMAARHARGEGSLAVLARERQDLAAEWLALDKVLHQSIAASPDRRDTTTERHQRERLAAIDRRRASIDDRLRTEFPRLLRLVEARSAGHRSHAKAAAAERGAGPRRVRRRRRVRCSP